MANLTDQKEIWHMTPSKLLKFIRHSPWQSALLAQAFWSASSFLVALYLARHLSVEEFGLYAIGVAGKMLFISILGALVISPLTVISGRYSDAAERSRIIKSTVNVLQVASLIVLLSTLLGELWWDQPIVSFGIYVIGGITVELQRRINFIQGLVHRDLIGGAWNTVGALAGLAILEGRGALNLEIVFLILGFIGLAWVIYIGRDHWLSVPTKFDGSLAKEFWDIGRWGMGSNMFGYLYAQVSTFLTFGLIGVAGVAVLELGRQLVNFVQIIMGGMANLLHTRLAKSARHATPEVFVREVWEMSGFQTLLGTALLLPVAWASQTVIPLLVPGKEYDYALVSTVTWITAAAMICQLLWQHPSFGVIALGKPAYGFLTRATTTAILIPIAYGLTVRFGVVGAAWSRVLGEAIVLVLSTVMLYRAAAASAVPGAVSPTFTAKGEGLGD